MIRTLPAFLWLDMAIAPRTGEEVLLLLGETIPDHANARPASFLSGEEADELGHRELAKYGGWLIWHDGGDWFAIDESEPLGWLPLPERLPRKNCVIEQFAELPAPPPTNSGPAS
jgi:hypothetical protein